MRIFISILLIFSTSISIANEKNFEWTRLKHDGYKITAAKSAVKIRYGKGEIRRPYYECGFHSGKSYYQIVYAGFTYIGSNAEGFILEKFNFNKANNSRLTYRGVELNNKISKEKFAEIVGAQAKSYFVKHPDTDSILLHEKSDDAAFFKFKNNLLVSYAYWSPC